MSKHKPLAAWGYIAAIMLVIQGPAPQKANPYVCTPQFAHAGEKFTSGSRSRSDYQIRSLFGDRDDRCVGVSSDNAGHDRRVHNPQPI